MLSRNARFLVIAVLLSGCVGSRGLLATAPNVTYTASGTFAAPAIAGLDRLGLAGTPYTFTVVVSSALPPAKYQVPIYAVYYPVTVTGTVYPYGNIFGPFLINGAALSLSSGDHLQFGFQFLDAGLDLTILAKIDMPKGTLTTLHIRPFTAPVTLTSSNATVSYSDTTASTTLGMTGTLNATLPGGGQAITAGLQSPVVYSGPPAVISRRWITSDFNLVA